MRKIRAALFAAGLLIGTALGQQPAPAPPAVPVNPPAPVNPAPPVVPVVPPAGTVVLDAPKTVPAYGFAKCRLTGPFKGAGWFCIPRESTGAVVVQSSQSRTFSLPGGSSESIYEFSGPPGRYGIYVFGASATGDVTACQDDIVFLPPVVPPTPVPTPIPTPTPGPTPSPTPPPLPGPNPGPTPGPGPAPKPFPSTQISPVFPIAPIAGRGVARG